MKKIATAAALLLAIGSGAALAQGAPPGSPSWNDSWPGIAEAPQARAVNTHKANETHANQVAQAKARYAERAQYRATR
ncbi:MAG TPA: hypothetical protein VJ779_22635 [Acetobacteraceae bacterium]|nr:hypothetical protein [Acetobacteraceae bacterium]